MSCSLILCPVHGGIDPVKLMDGLVVRPHRICQHWKTLLEKLERSWHLLPPVLLQIFRIVLDKVYVLHLATELSVSQEPLPVLLYLNQDYILVPAESCDLFADAESRPLFLLRNMLSSRAPLIVQDQHNIDKKQGSCSLQLRPANGKVDHSWTS